MKRRTFLAGLLSSAAIAPLAMAATKTVAVVPPPSAPLPKALVFGRFSNVPADWAGAEDLIFRLSDLPITRIEAVYEGGVPLKVGPDFETLAELKAADIEPGTVATCNALGRIRLAAAPAYSNSITADVDASTDNCPVNLVDGAGLLINDEWHNWQLPEIALPLRSRMSVGTKWTVPAMESPIGAMRWSA